MKDLKKIISGVIAMTLICSAPLPAAAYESGSSDAQAFDVSASAAAGDVEGAVTAVEKAAEGGYYVAATNNAAEETGHMTSDGLYIYKYDETLTQIEHEYKVEKGAQSLGNYTASNGAVYPLFLDEASRVSAADSRFNTPFAQDKNGNIYVAYKSVDNRSMIALSSISEHKQIFPDCICDKCDSFNQGAKGTCSKLKEKNDGDEGEASDGGDTGSDQYEAVYDCPVCNAWHEAYKSINANQSVVRLVVEKLDPSLKPIAKYDAAYDIGAQ